MCGKNLVTNGEKGFVMASPDDKITFSRKTHKAGTPHSIDYSQIDGTFDLTNPPAAQLKVFYQAPGQPPVWVPLTDIKDYNTVKKTKSYLPSAVGGNGGVGIHTLVVVVLDNDGTSDRLVMSVSNELHVSPSA